MSECRERFIPVLIFKNKSVELPECHSYVEAYNKAIERLEELHEDGTTQGFEHFIINKIIQWDYYDFD
jgi:hypothetical protein